MPENRQAAIIYQLVEGQIITRFNGHHDDIIDLNYGALKTVMDLYEIKDQKMVFEKVRKLFFYFLENRNRE